MRMTGCRYANREGNFAELDFRLDWDNDAVQLRVAKRGDYALPYYRRAPGRRAVPARAPNRGGCAPTSSRAGGSSIRCAREPDPLPSSAQLCHHKDPAALGPMSDPKWCGFSRPLPRLD